MRRGLIVASLLLPPAAAAAQTVHVTGDVALRPELGWLRGNLCLSGLPEMDTVTFVLNRGLDIGVVRDGSGTALPFEGFYDGEWLGEGLLYDVPAPESGSIGTLCVEYAGAVPVYDGNPVIDDWKGRIVANRGTLRATEQAKWYPILYDRAAGSQETMVTYALDVECASCTRLYLNGAPPAAAPHARFASDVPRPLLLFAGDFEQHEEAGLMFLGGAVTADAAAAFRTDVDAISSAFAEFLDVPYEGSPVFLTFLSIAQRRTPGRSSWAFVTWPTVAFDGAIDFASVLEGGRLPAWLRRTLGHELGHYYFGTVLRPTGALHWFYLESMAEYLALRRIREADGPEAFSARVDDLRTGALRAGDVVPLSRVTRPTQIGDSYRYQLAPLWLVSLEDRTDGATMGRLLHDILTAPAGRQRDWAFFLRAAADAGVPEATLNAWVSECVEAPVAEGCIANVGR